MDFRARKLQGSDFRSGKWDFRRGVLRAHAPLNSAWSSHTFAPPCANACAVFRPCGLRFAPCPRGSSRFAASDARKLACGTPCFIGLTSACFAHCARPPCAPRPSTPSGLRRAYFALLRAQRARFVRPLWERGAFWIVALPYEAALPKSLP